jgi:hypothetical protein
MTCFAPAWQSLPPRWPQYLFGTDLSPHTSALAALQQLSRAELYLRLDTQPDVNMSTTGIYACATHAECVMSSARRLEIVPKIYHRSPVRHRTIGQAGASGPGVASPAGVEAPHLT